MRRRGAPAAATDAQHEAICSRRDALKLPLDEGLQPRARNPAARQVHRLVSPRTSRLGITHLNKPWVSVSDEGHISLW